MRRINIRNIDKVVILFIFLLLFMLPLIFTKINGRLDWRSILKIWQDRVLLIPLFAINHWFLVPGLILKKQYAWYCLAVLSLVAFITAGYYFYDNPPVHANPPVPRPLNNNPVRPEPIPPYADLLLFALLIAAVDTGLSFTRHWHASEEEKVRLEKDNIQAQLGMLRNQISPHFFMNTLNNIYSLIDGNKEKSKQAIMKLSKLMRYLLYENQNGKVLLSREFDFIRSYVDLMKLRYVDEIEISLELPEKFDDLEIPVFLFISYLENAFKYGPSYEQKSFIDASFIIENEYLLFLCANSRNAFSEQNSSGGIGMKNSVQRLGLLYGDKYSLSVDESEEIFRVKLKIPLR